jgi:hypothetical protein
MPRSHLKELVETLGQVVKRDRISAIVIAGDDVVTAHLKTQLPERLVSKVSGRRSAMASYPDNRRQNGLRE